MSIHEQYTRRLAERLAAVSFEERRHVQIGNLRLAIGIAGAWIAYSVFAAHSLDPWWLAAPVLAFAPLVIWHSRVERRRTLARRAVQFYERGIACIEDRWQGTGETGERFRDAAHVYADDLDLFGAGGLFQLLSQARTRAGEEKLARWLSAPSPVDAIRARQQAIGELRDSLDLRESLFVLGEDARDTVHTDHLIGWAEAKPILHDPPRRLLGALLTLYMLIAAGIAQTTGRLELLAVGFGAVAGFGFYLRPRVLRVLHQVDEAVHDLGLLAAVLGTLEKHAFQSPAMIALQGKLTATRASASISSLHRIAEWIDSRDNVFVRTFGPPLLYGTHLAFAAEAWRANHGPHIRAWLDAMSELEALLSLAAYASEHPADPFPEFVAATEFHGEQLGHPLLAAGRCVRNSITLDAAIPMRIVSGSNMSGKSTYLRTIGINAVLAMAGAPIRGRSLRLSALQLGAAIRVNDSLQGGSSRFFAEITRLRKIMDQTTGTLPVLFLLDEMLNGTNSHDRALGAEGVLRELVTRGAIGLVTTHDLALTRMAEPLRARNVHFEDTFADGKLHFEYTVRDGVVEKSNALELMRSIGLDV